MRSIFFSVIVILLFLAMDASAQIHAYVQMDFEGPVELLVTDSQGKRCGYNPFTNTDYNEIPYAGYGLGSYDEDKEFGFNTALKDTLFSTTYTIQIFGTGSGTFIGDGGGAQTLSGRGLDFHVVGVIDSTETVTFVFNYSTDSTVTPTFMKVVTSQIIHQDFENSFKLRLLNDPQLYGSLENILSVFEQDLARADSASARQQLLLLQQTLNSKASDTTNVTPVPQGMISADAWNILNGDVQSLIVLLPSAPPGFIVKLINSGGANLTSGSLQYYEGSWKDATNNNDGTFTINTTAKTLSLRMTYEYGTQTKSNVTVGPDTAVFQTVNAQIRLQDSKGNLIDTGTVQYYAGAWRNLGTTTNGVAAKELLPNNYSFRMTYAYGSNDKQQDIGTNAVVIFQTVSAIVQLQNSQGSLMDQGTVQYYSGAWRDFGVTTNGVATKELLPNNYTFRLTYAYASNDKQQNIGTNPTVVFQTVSAAVQLQNSQGSLMDQGTVQYYSGAWRDFGTTVNGVSMKELLPNNYSFRMTYAYGSNDKQQNIGTNPTVVFQTVNAAVQLQNSQGSLMDQGTVQYYSGAWRDFGITTNGVATKELLPNNYTFRMTYAYASNDKQQNVGTNSTVVFKTVNATAQLQNSQGTLMDRGTVQYYSGAWRDFGITTNGIVTKELLPNNYTFRMTYEFVSNDKAQDISANSTVTFSTVLCTVQVKDSQNQPVNNVQASYYSGAWRQIGATVNGVVTKELLPANLTFRITYGTNHQDKTQNLSTNNVVDFSVQP